MVANSNNSIMVPGTCRSENSNDEEGESLHSVVALSYV